MSTPLHAVTATRPIPIGERCVLCGCGLTTQYWIERGLCGSCADRPDGKALPRDGKGRAVPRSPSIVAPTPAPAGNGNGHPSRTTAVAHSRPFTAADKSLIKSTGAFLPAADLLKLLNDRLAADRPELAPYTMEQLAAELAAAIQPSTANWAWMRYHLRRARQSGLLATITATLIEDFAVVYSLNPAQLLHLQDLIASAKEDQ